MASTVKTLDWLRRSRTLTAYDLAATPELRSRWRPRTAAAAIRAGPDLIDVEILHALRGVPIRAEITPERAADARTDLAEAAPLRCPHEPLSDRIWEQRHNLSAYGAAFVALAETLDRPARDPRLVAALCAGADFVKGSR